MSSNSSWPPCTPDELGGDREPEPRSALARRALERAEEVGARLGRHTGPVVGDLDEDLAPVAPSLDADLARLALTLLLDRLHGVADEVAQDPEQVLVIGIDAEVLVHVDDPARSCPRAAARAPRRLRRPRASAAELAARLGLLGSAEFQRVVAEVDGAIERGDELRGELLHGRIGNARSGGRR